MKALATQQPTNLADAQASQLIVRIALNSNLYGLPDADVWAYYRAMCERLELDPMSHPFDVLTDEKAKTKKLYPNAQCTAQLGERRKYSYGPVEIQAEQGLVALGFKVARVSLTVTAPDGRTLTGESFIDLMSGWEGQPLKGNNLQNALKKAATQARRRGTLQMAGLAIPSEQVEVAMLGDIEEHEDQHLVIEHPTPLQLEQSTTATLAATQEDFWAAARAAGVQSGDAAPIAKRAATGEITWNDAIGQLPS